MKWIGLLLIILIPTSFVMCGRAKDYELVMVYRWGKLDELPKDSGPFLYIPFIDSIHRYDTRQKELTIIDKPLPDQGSTIEPKGVGALTRDGIKIGVIVRIFYAINKEKGKYIIDNFSANDSELSTKLIEKRIDAEIRHSIQHLCPQYYMRYLLENRSELVHNIYVGVGKEQDADLSKQVDKYGNSIEVIPPLPQNSEKLYDIGIDIKQITIEFDPPKEFIDILARIAYNEILLLEEEQQIILLEKKKDTARKKSELSELNAKALAVEIKTINEERKNVPIHTQFIEKWSGNLPYVLIVNGSIEDAIKR